MRSGYLLIGTSLELHVYMLKPGIYKLLIDLANPNPDRRLKRDWRGFPVWNSGWKFIVDESDVHAARDSEVSCTTISLVGRSQLNHSIGPELAGQYAVLESALVPCKMFPSRSQQYDTGEARLEPEDADPLAAGRARFATAREAAEYLRRRAPKMDAADGEAVAALLDHTMAVEMALDLIASSARSALSSAPEAAVLRTKAWPLDRDGR